MFFNLTTVDHKGNFESSAHADYETAVHAGAMFVIESAMTYGTNGSPVLLEGWNNGINRAIRTIDRFVIAQAWINRDERISAMVAALRDESCPILRIDLESEFGADAVDHAEETGIIEMDRFYGPTYLILAPSVDGPVDSPFAYGLVTDDGSDSADWDADRTV